MLNGIRKSWAFPFVTLAIALAGSGLLYVYRTGAQTADYQAAFALEAGALVNIIIAFTIRKSRLQLLTGLFLACAGVALTIAVLRLTITALTI
jgi:hypothetical protein